MSSERSTDFCPRCGAFTQPRRDRRIGADGSVVWLEGINERNHEHSFVHAELHEENRERRGTVLEQEQRRPGRIPAAKRSQIPVSRGKAAERGPATIVKWIVLAIVGVHLLGGLVPLLLF